MYLACPADSPIGVSAKLGAKRRRVSCFFLYEVKAMAKFKLPGFHISAEVLISALQGEERVAGIVIEYDRVRYAEFRKAKKGETSHLGRVLVGEGAVTLPEGTIRGGALVHPEALTEALRKLKREGKPKPLQAAQVIIAIPIVRLVGSTISIPAGLSGDAADGAISLEIESLLPFPIEESYVDWQPITGQQPDGTQQEFLYVGARTNEVEPYISAVQRAGLGVVAVEPVTLAMTRGLEVPGKVVYIAKVTSDALLGTAIDEMGNVRYFHHRSLPAISGKKVGLGDKEKQVDPRSQRLALELAAFIRFLKEEFGDREQELIVDGDLDENAIKALSGLTDSLGIPVRLEHETHLLSRAAVRGVALRGILPRSEDTLVSLMATGTDAAYAEKQAIFFFKTALRMLIGGAVVTAVLLAGTLGLLFSIQVSTAKQATQQEAQISDQTRMALEMAKAVNGKLAEIVGLLQKGELPTGAVSAIREAKPDGIRVDRILTRLFDGSVWMDLAVEAQTGSDLLKIEEILQTRFAKDPSQIDVPADVIFRGNDIPFVFQFELNVRAL